MVDMLPITDVDKPYKLALRTAGRWQTVSPVRRREVDSVIANDTVTIESTVATAR